MTVKALKIVAEQIKRVFSFLFAPHMQLTRVNFLTELFCVGVNNWVKELATSDVIDVEREKVRSSGKRKGAKR